jgi:hypothetical protein
MNDEVPPFDYTPLQVLLLAVCAVMLMMAFGCTQHSSGTVVYMDDSGEPYMCEYSTRTHRYWWAPTRGACRVKDALDANP